MSNFGDQLYPRLLRHALSAAGVDDALEFFAVTRRTKAVDGVPVRPMGAIAGTEPRALLVGGGHVIRSDRSTVVQDHVGLSLRQRSRRLQLRARIKSGQVPRGPGPWLPERWPVGDACPVGWISVGVDSLADTPETRRALSHVSRAWIRSPASLQRAVAAGIDERRCHLGPDLAFALPDAVDVEELASRGRHLFRRLTGSEQPVVVHGAPFLGWDAKALATHLAGLRGLPLVLVSMGRYVREDKELRAAAKALNAATAADVPVKDMLAMLAAAPVTATTSMHAAICAATCGNRVVVVGGEKIADAFSIAAGFDPPLSATPGAAAAAIGEAFDVAGGGSPQATAVGQVIEATSKLLRGLGL